MQSVNLRHSPHPFSVEYPLLSLKARVTRAVAVW